MELSHAKAVGRGIAFLKTDIKPSGTWLKDDESLNAVGYAALPALAPLSDRERDVLHLLALGYTNQEIAGRMFISVRTVDTHRAHIMLKLRLETRAELVMFALANGVIGQ